MIHGNWICPSNDLGEVCPVFRKKFICAPGTKVVLSITALGIYSAQLNGNPITEDLFTPGWTNYRTRLQVQTYDLTPFLQEENALTVTLAKGWFQGRIAHNHYDAIAESPRLLAALTITKPDGEIINIPTDKNWQWAESPIRFSDIYDGEVYDARIVPNQWLSCVEVESPKPMLIPQEGLPIRAQERLKPVELIHTPAGETVLDFGQEITGMVEFSVTAKSGDEVHISHAEVLDAEGNFYTANLRSAKAQIHYICKDSTQTYRPHHTFMGFRYIRLDQFPGAVKPEDFTAVVVHSNMKRTGYIRTSNALLNRLYENVIWGQKCNFLDVPTDCPQRDERFGWLGDAQVFVATAARNFDVKNFFRKWMRDMATEQRADGALPHVVPVVGIGGWEQESESFCSGTAWADAAVICPWQIYMAYGDKELLKENLPMMKKWVDFMRRWGEKEEVFEGHFTYGDWLAMDGPEGSYRGISDEGLLGTAYYAYCTDLLSKAMDALGEDSTMYWGLYKKIVHAFQKKYSAYRTQTECAVALYFGLAADPAATAAQLAQLVRNNGNRLTTGFIGTPYLLHALSENGYAELAYTLLLQQEYPSWLFSVNMGATTIWEHWDSRKADGSFWSTDMNSFNHYAYGSVADWMYAVPGGIRLDSPGYSSLTLQPVTDRRLDFFEASIETIHGVISTHWHHEKHCTIYRFDTPIPARICLPGQEFIVPSGHYEYQIFG